MLREFELDVISIKKSQIIIHFFLKNNNPKQEFGGIRT